MIKKVGLQYKDRVSKKFKLFCYRHVFTDKDKWVDAEMYLPADHDLVYMKLKNGRTIQGWASGMTWEGLRLKPEDTVLRWKRKEEKESLCR